jgi:hypothetical protein
MNVRDETEQNVHILLFEIPLAVHTVSLYRNVNQWHI